MQNTKCTHLKIYAAVRHIGGLTVWRCCACNAVV